MKRILNYSIALMLIPIFLSSCGESSTSEEHHHDHGEHEDESAEEVHLSNEQFSPMDMKVNSLEMRNLSDYIEANGQLEVPPQNEAIVTAIIGGNVKSIKVVEGDKVSKGQVLAYLSHPDIINLQTEYAADWNQLNYLTSDYERQKKLYDENVGSGKEFQKVKAEYLSMKSRVAGKDLQLRLLGLSVSKIQNGEVFANIPVKSPISGHVRLVEVKMGQYVRPEKDMFEIVNIDEIHADLMVFEKDMHKVKKGQKVRFSVQSNKDEELEAVIYSVGKAFEEEPKALHLHAEIVKKKGYLIPGMYISAQISISDKESLSIPEAGLVKEGEKYFMFSAEKHDDSDVSEWGFKPIEVKIGIADNGWVEVRLLEPLKEGTQVAFNNAYYLMAEMKKGEAEHTH